MTKTPKRASIFNRIAALQRSGRALLLAAASPVALLCVAAASPANAATANPTSARAPAVQQSACTKDQRTCYQLWNIGERNEKGQRLTAQRVRDFFEPFFGHQLVERVSREDVRSFPECGWNLEPRSA